MRQGRSTGTPTRSEAARFDAIREIGCVVARIRQVGMLPCEIHHLNLGGLAGQRRRGHRYTIGLNSWSHRAQPLPGWTRGRCRKVLGPSLAEEPGQFREAFGGDEVLLETQDRLIEAWRRLTAPPWEQAS